MKAWIRYSREPIKDLNEELQTGLALGSFVIKPIGPDKVEYITADRIIPIEFGSIKIREISHLFR